MKKILLLLIFFVFPLSYSFAWDSNTVLLDQNKTIKELNWEIEELNKAKFELTLTKDFVLDKTVKSFFKSDLTEIQFQKIEEIVEKYNNNKNILEKKLIQASKDLLDTTIEINEELKNLRKWFYEDLLDFVDINHYSNYVYYIKEQTNFYAEEKELDSSVIKKTEIVNEKITSIEEKIKEHNSSSEESLRELVNLKVDEKLNQIKIDKSFISLWKDEKINFVDNILFWIEKVKNNLIFQNESGNITRNLIASNEKKIDICKMMTDRFMEFRDSLEEQK